MMAPHATRCKNTLTWMTVPVQRWASYMEVLNLLGRDNPVELEPRLDLEPDTTMLRLSEIAK